MPTHKKESLIITLEGFDSLILDHFRQTGFDSGLNGLLQRGQGGGCTVNAHIIDFAPTILDFFDLPIPDWMKGKILPIAPNALSTV